MWRALQPCADALEINVKEIDMKHLILALAFIPTGAMADFFTRTTDQFGIVAADIGPDFRVAVICTVLAGEVESKAEWAEWIPQVGPALSKAIDIASLDKGVSVCGLRHSEKAGISASLADTRGFDQVSAPIKTAKSLGKSPRV